MTKEVILIYICAVLFVISLYCVIQNVKLKNLMNEQIKKILNNQISTKSRLDMVEVSKPNVVTIRCSKVISKQEMYDLDSDMLLKKARQAILKEFSEELGNYVTYHIYDDKKYATMEIVGFLRVIKEGRGEE